MFLRTRMFLAAGFVVASIGVASASPIIYTATFTVSGSLGGVSYTNQLVTLTGIGDTDSILDATANPVSVTCR